jgi:hypothetical protein
MAKLKRTLEPAEHSALSPALRELYTERGGKYVLDADDAEGLLASLETERQAKKALEAQLAGFGKLTPEEVKKIQESAAKAEREKDFASGNFEKILAEERAKHQKDLELRDQGEARLRSSLESALIDAEAVRAITAHGGNPELLLPIIKARTKLQTVGEQEVAVIIGDKGGPRLKTGAKSSEEYMGMGEFVAELKSDKRYAGAFASGMGSGTGGARTDSRPSVRTQQGDAVAKIAAAVSEGATRLAE